MTRRAKAPQTQLRAKVHAHATTRSEHTKFTLDAKAVKNLIHRDSRYNQNTRGHGTLWLTFETNGVEIVGFVTVADARTLRLALDAAIDQALVTEPCPTNCYLCRSHEDTTTKEKSDAP